MEVNNISAQLFNQQLKPDVRASYYGCKDDMLTNHLTTCVDDLNSDAQLENTFQKQLDLSDFYKGQSVFDEIKKDFMDRTMDHENNPTETIPSIREPVVTSSAKPVIEVGPRDFLFSSIFSKEFFGKKSTGKTFLYLLLAALLIFIVVFLLIKYK